MLLADVMMWILLVIGVLFAFPGLWLLSRGLYSQDVEEMAVYLERGRIKPFFAGLPVTVVSFLGVAICGDKHQAFTDLAALVFVAFFLFYSNVGVAALATMIGQKLPSPADDQRPWKSTIRGGVVLELSYLLPILGWFFILPVSLTVGAGAVTLRLFSRGKKLPPVGAHTSIKRAEKTDADEVVGATG